MRIGNRTFDTANHTYVMGILNVTPDSFSDGGSYNQLDLALKHVEEMMAQGADIIDVGGESTRPGYTKISDEEEIERTVPVVEAIVSRFDVPVSVDTYKSRVAEANLAAGAHLLNDIWGLKADDKMAGVIAKYDAACCLMHNRNEADYTNFMEDMKAIKCALVEFVESKLDCLDEINSNELGLIIDMIKDMSEAIYYCTMTKTMKEKTSSKQLMEDILKMSPKFTENEKTELKNIVMNL